MVQVKFYGSLKRFADEPLELEVSNFKELMSGLLTQIKGLRQHLRHGYYKVRVGSKYLSEERLKATPLAELRDGCMVHFTPVICGAGKGVSFGQFILGAVLIAAAFWTGGASIAAWGTGATMMGAMGASLLLTGVAGLLTKMPDMNNKYNEGEKKQSTSFSNIKNLTPQGRPIPLLYGKMLTSLVLISQGIETFDDMIDTKDQTKKNSRPFFFGN
ncbi:tail assembly protein [Haemophilus influenzae]|uniref:tail assembly protein n=1 Tax=Haemophilus influenzae TaxID=727 RepID=UPI0001DDDF00|nr:tail assembly protein [Haemophilus influenzae]CVQ11944.1 Phage-related protein%2C tail component [Streptococcus pneumoniae]CBW28525.1 putative phage tail assembly protein [Haemophilus influenzae 10810]CWW94478.1 putative phage tail assembly protein [Haemophilus influenzae]CWX14439.1 putative phage tail assembly protein [Haemophilus influenzae]CWX27213.1 putative phage tail assembly protein [Haemophilus influenzae]